MAATAWAAAAAIAGFPAPILPSVYDSEEPELELNIFAAGELDAELGRRGPKDSLATSLASEESTSVVGLLSEWLMTDGCVWMRRRSGLTWRNESW